MTSSNFNLRGISPEAMAILKREAKAQNISVNSLLLRIIEQGIGFSGKKKKSIYHDLDHLAGTWSEEEGRRFEENIKTFEEIDEELWKFS